ncbi:MAG TPA: (Fe-S)-binding protein [Actinobacteria bacterium]|nr:(Fe-S)-binding protein [Actinomycetota bacterium]
MDPLALLPTCVVEALAPRVGAAAIRVLRSVGYEPHIPDGVTCCGQPAWNAGAVEEAARVARTTLAALATEPAVCVLAGSCATMVRVYWPELFDRVGDPDAAVAAREVASRTTEFTELVARHLDRVRSPGTGERVAYHRSCHMTRELHLRDEPHEVLRRAGCDVEPWEADDRCCGFGGLFAVVEPEVSVAMADDKLRALPDVDALVGADLSCLLQLEGRLRALGLDLPVRHVAELLDPGR